MMPTYGNMAECQMFRQEEQLYLHEEKNNKKDVKGECSICSLHCQYYCFIALDIFLALTTA